MSRTVLLVVLICAAIALQGQTSGSEIRINEVFRKTPLSKALKDIEATYKVKIAYDHSAVHNIIVALQLKDLTLSQSLERLLEGTGLEFHNVGDNIIIVPRPTRSNGNAVEKVDIRVSGIIVDADSEETLPQATIRVMHTNIATTTNNDGHFTIFDIPADTCQLEIRYLGFITQSLRVKDIRSPDHFQIKLRSDTKILNEVVVFDEYNQAIHPEEAAGATVFNPASLGNLPSLGEQDISRTLQLMPGVSATDESSAGMIIRGSHSSYNLTLLDGMTIYQQDHFFGSFSIINSDIIKDVHIHKGMFDAKYGARVSGVVDITSKNGNAVKPHFNFKLNFINAKGTAEIPLGKKWSFFAGARRSFTDVVQSSLFNRLLDIARLSNDQIHLFRFFEGLGNEVTPAFYFFDANSKLSFRPSTRDVMSLSFYVSRDRMNISDSSFFGDDNDNFVFENTEVTRWGNNGASLRWGRQWTDRYYTNFRISDSKFFRRYYHEQYMAADTMSSTYMLAFKNSITDLTYAIDNQWSLHDRLSMEFGWSGIRQGTQIRFQDKYVLSGDTPEGEIPEDTDVSEEKKSWLHSLYGSLNLSPLPKLSTTLGARLVHYYMKAGYVYFEPRATARYKISETLNLKGGYGRSNQFITQLFYPSTTGSISGISENFWIQADAEDVRYPAISSDHFTAGATLKQKYLSYDAEVYYKENRGVIIDENLNSGNTRMYGLDLMVQKTTGIHKGWIAYSLARGIQEHPYIFSGKSGPSWQDQRHELKIVDMLALGNWNLASTAIFGSGKPYQKYIVKYHRDENGIIDGYGLLLDYSNRSRLPAYFRIDLAISYKVKIKNSFEMEAGLSVHNVTDHRNVKTRRVDTVALDEAVLNNTELPASYNDIVLLGFSPTLFLNASF